MGRLDCCAGRSRNGRRRATWLVTSGWSHHRPGRQRNPGGESGVAAGQSMQVGCCQVWNHRRGSGEGFLPANADCWRPASRAVARPDWEKRGRGARRSSQHERRAPRSRGVACRPDLPAVPRLLHAQEAVVERTKDGSQLPVPVNVTSFQHVLTAIAPGWLPCRALGWPGEPVTVNHLCGPSPRVQGRWVELPALCRTGTPLPDWSRSIQNRSHSPGPPALAGSEPLSIPMTTVCAEWEADPSVGLRRFGGYGAIRSRRVTYVSANWHLRPAT